MPMKSPSGFAKSISVTTQDFLSTSSVEKSSNNWNLTSSFAFEQSILHSELEGLSKNISHF